MRKFALTPSTSLLAVTALADIAYCAPDLSQREIASFAADVLKRIESQPKTVLELSATSVLEMRDQLISNCGAWPLKQEELDVPEFMSDRDPGDEDDYDGDPDE